MNYKSEENINKMLSPEQIIIIKKYVEIDSFYEYVVKDASVIEYDEDDTLIFIYLEDEENNIVKFTFLEKGISIIINNVEDIEKYENIDLKEEYSSLF